jgi:endonuclease/exonuclease/phosphatase family metal-dependent hydrolase
MHLLTWNVHGFRDAVGRRIGPEIVDALRRLDAPVIALQEIDSKARPGLAKLPLEVLADAYPYQRTTYTIVNAWRRYGHALLSRVPLEDGCEHDVRCRGLEMRRVLDATVTLPDRGRVRVLAAHLDLAPWARWSQLRRLAALASQGVGPTVVVGDLNVWTAYGVRRRTGDALELVPSPPTFPASRPVAALDRALCRPAGLVRRAWVPPVPPGLSDHLPLALELHELPASGGSGAGEIAS